MDQCGVHLLKFKPPKISIRNWTSFEWIGFFVLTLRQIYRLCCMLHLISNATEDSDSSS